MSHLMVVGAGDMTELSIDPSLMTPGEGEVLADLIRAAYADARRKLDDINTQLMRDAAASMGPGAVLPDLPKFF